MQDSKIHEGGFLESISAKAVKYGYLSILPSQLEDVVVASMIGNIQGYMLIDKVNKPDISLPLYYVAKLAGRNIIEEPVRKSFSFSEIQFDRALNVLLLALIYESDCRSTNIIHAGLDQLFLKALDEIFE
jgi:hypothetical protein